MINVFFNDNNEFKYDLSFYICKHYFTFHLFDNFEKFRDHDIEYHDYDIRFAKFKYCSFANRERQLMTLI